MKKLFRNIDWRSKIVDLFIVVIGITIAFRLNSWKEDYNCSQTEKYYLESFLRENSKNRKALLNCIAFCDSVSLNVDTLARQLRTKEENDWWMKRLTLSMTAQGDYTPSTTILNNISVSSEFATIQDPDLREQIISTYNSHEATVKMQNILSEFVTSQVTPFLWKNIRYSTSKYGSYDFRKDPIFENLVNGYQLLLRQQIKGYKKNLAEIDRLDEALKARAKKVGL
ncbi:MAG: hypothetical protein CMN32_01365 [Saprospirales bacterium]|nr:hypothetical protein [Saprospirales bacterium]